MFDLQDIREMNEKIIDQLIESDAFKDLIRLWQQLIELYQKINAKGNHGGV
jgi:hypothetical protein